jgi:hypothetical protein
MRGGATIRTGVTLVVAMAGAAAAHAQVPTMRIDDVRVVERSSGPWSLSLTVTLSQSSTSTVSAGWSTVDGSAIAGSDYTSSSGTVTFPPGSTTQPISVTLAGGITIEWNSTLQMDRAFFVQLASPTNAILLKSRATVTIVDDDRAQPGLQLVSAVADGSPGSGRVRLQWRVPPSTPSGAPTDVLVRWNEGSSCAAPATATSLPVTGEFLISNPPLPTLPATVNPAGETQVFEHLGQSFLKHCYSLFAVYSPGGTTTEKAVVSATPFDTTASNVAWTYSIGGAAPGLVPPTVGSTAVYTVSTDGVVHAMTRGLTGGAWPAGWNPVGLGKPAHNRSPIVPLAWGQRLFVGTEQGEVHAVDGEDGAIAWSRSAAFKNTQLPYSLGYAQGTPAGLFTDFGGQNDVILVGSNQTGSNTFFLLDPVTGANVSTYSDGSMGGVPGMPVVDYTSNRTYFLTTLPAGVLWAFDLGSAGSPGLTRSTLPSGNPISLAYASNGSPVLSNARVYFGATNGDVVAYRPASGQTRALSAGDGEVKGFVFPDRRNNSFYFSTTSKIWGITDTGSPDPLLSMKWLPVTDILTPATVLHWTGTKYLYVGGGDGRLYQIDVDSGSLATVPAKTSVLLEAGRQIGPPSLDGPNGLVLVGSETGVIYAVRVPLP